MIRNVLATALLSGVFAGAMFSQTVTETGGNVFFTGKDKKTIQITSLGLDSDPCISSDGGQVVFVRRTPSLNIDTGLGNTNQNELWIADTSGTPRERRILVGHSGTFKADDSLTLAGFSRPQFSPDGTRVYFLAITWATAHSIRMLDLKSETVRFLYAGASVEVIQSGKYGGCLIGDKAIPHVLAARVFRYWLMDQDGGDIGEIGEHPANVEEFKSEQEGRDSPVVAGGLLAHDSVCRGTGRAN